LALAKGLGLVPGLSSDVLGSEVLLSSAPAPPVPWSSPGPPMSEIMLPAVADPEDMALYLVRWRGSLPLPPMIRAQMMKMTMVARLLFALIACPCMLCQLSPWSVVS
ncbi:MAG: hypothetical protein Q8O19_00065, partial [Rectinemataceae bacterium]|nr:hypothetical protein [Rectinemataceae bacterium]